MQMKIVQWKRSQTLAEDYIVNQGRAKELFPYHYGNLDDWQKRAASLNDANSVLQAERGRLIEVLTAYNQRIRNSQNALDRISSLADKKALVVVGGQQAGLFGGPLLVLYKAITIIQLARQWSEKLGQPVVPIFWLAGEDHDFDEVNHTYTLLSEPQIHKLKVEHPTGRRTSVSKLPLQPEAWREALEALDQSLMDTEFKAELLAKIQQTVEGQSTLSDAFAKWMATLFGEYGLVIIDSDEPALRGLEGAFFEQLIAQNQELTSALLQSRNEVEAAGYEAQAEIAEHGANLFIYESGQRLLLHRDGDRFVDKKQDFSYTAEQLRDFALTSPDRLSNNVLTRPLMQEFLFPVLATVLGPGEIAYWTLTKKAFERFGMRMPIVVPRLEFTLVEGTVHKHMSKYGLALNDVFERFEEKKQAWLDAQDDLNLAERFEAVKSEFRANYEPLVESLTNINPGVNKLGETNLAKIIEQIDYLERKAEEGRKIQFDAALRQLERIRLTFVPLAKPQERVYNSCAYLNRYGYDWLKNLIETPIAVDGAHRVYYL